MSSRMKLWAGPKERRVISARIRTYFSWAFQKKKTKKNKCTHVQVALCVQESDRKHIF